MATRISNQSGQSLVLGLMLLPICLLLISGFVWLSEFVFLKQRQLEICRSQVLEQNDFALKQISALLELNSVVSALRAQRLATLAAIAAANASLNPELLPPLIAQLKRIEAQQKFLALAQIKILSGFKVTSLARMYAGSKTISESAEAFHLFQPKAFVLPNFSLQLPVQKMDDQNPALFQVDRKLAASFHAEYFWQVQLLPRLPLLENGKRIWKSKCSARILERNQKWIKILNWDRP